MVTSSFAPPGLDPKRPRALPVPKGAAELPGFNPDSSVVSDIIPSANFGERNNGLVADMIVLHYTGMPDAEGAIARLCTAGTDVSAHYIVLEDGRVVQTVPESKRAWHAGLGFWAAFDGDEFVGLVWAPPAHGPDQPDDPTVCDLGYRLLRRCWRRGYATEASRELLRHAFETVGQSRVIGQTQEGNAGSRAVMERLGMRFVRTYHSLDYPEQGPEVQEVEYELTRETWRDSQGAPRSSD